MNNYYRIIKILGPLNKVAGVYQVLLTPISNTGGKNLIRNVMGSISLGDIVNLLDTSKEERQIR